MKFTVMTAYFEGCIGVFPLSISKVYCVPFTRTVSIVTGLPPGHEAVIFTPAADQPHGDPTFSCSPLPMNENDSAPIHAATAMLTATVTAMRMIEATTGLRAFLLFNIFIFCFVPPFGVNVYVNRGLTFKSYDLRHHIIYL